MWRARPRDHIFFIFCVVLLAQHLSSPCFQHLFIFFAAPHKPAVCVDSFLVREATGLFYLIF